MNKVTFSITYYGQVDRLQYQLDFFDKLPSDIKESITLQILNDGYNDGGVFKSLLELYKDSSILENIDTVYHCVANVPLSKDKDLFYRNNVESTRVLLDACLKKI